MKRRPFRGLERSQELVLDLLRERAQPLERPLSVGGEANDMTAAVLGSPRRSMKPCSWSSSSSPTSWPRS